MFDISKIIKASMPTKEEIEVMFKETYARNLETPENFSKWFPALKEAIDVTETNFKYPESKWLTLPFEWVRWLKNDTYAPEQIVEFSDYLKKELNLEKGKTYFIKTGVFSNKFMFKYTKVIDIDLIGEQFINIFYASACVGADSTNEIVVREYIEPEKDLKTIYYGMPLRTEFRVFVDIKGVDSEILGVVNYWHPEQMKKIHTYLPGIAELHLEQLPAKLKEIESLEDEQDENINRYNGDKDVIAYRLNEAHLVSEFEKTKDFVAENILEIAKNIKGEGLAGEWSIDVMKNGNDFYVIDAARKHRSALNEYI